jgi:endonuclease III
VKGPAESAKALASLLRKLARPEPAAPENGDPIEVMVRSFLMWEATTEKAAVAFKRITDRIVDFNDLRVSMPSEIVECIGARYPLALERSERLRAALRHAYKREHAMSLQRLRDLNRREVKQYMRSLDGICPYVADRVTLICFGGHCVPVDERLRRALVRSGVGDESADIAEMASWLARQVKAADAAATHQMLQAWCDQAGGAASESRRTATA